MDPLESGFTAPPSKVILKRWSPAAGTSIRYQTSIELPPTNEPHGGEGTRDVDVLDMPVSVPPVVSEPDVQTTTSPPVAVVNGNADVRSEGSSLC